MARNRILAFTLIGLVLISCLLIVHVSFPALSAASACRKALEHTEGYGPWQTQAIDLKGGAQGSTAVQSFFDGYNTAGCYAERYGPIWIVRTVVQTLVACSRGLSATGNQECPRAHYGVIP